MADRMIIVAGPSCCGKTTLVKRLLRGDAPDLAERCRMENEQSWTFGDIWLHEQRILRDIEDPGARLLVHYTIPIPSLKYLLRLGYDKRSRIRILTGADDIVVVTLVADPATLVTRVGLREQRQGERWQEGVISRSAYRRAVGKLHRLSNRYRDAPRVSRMYRNWFAFVAEIGAEHHLLDANGDDPTLIPSPANLACSVHTDAQRI